jgi:hypothetical protein
MLIVGPFGERRDWTESSLDSEISLSDFRAIRMTGTDLP